MNLAFVLGTRPEIIKLAPVIHHAQSRQIACSLIHTNQHYSTELDQRFFEELELDIATTALGVGSGTHGQQTAEMLSRIEEALYDLDVTCLVVQGDTNSALAGALAGAKAPCLVAHVEAGLRSYDLRMPEEINRRVIDHISDDVFPPTPSAHALLEKESVPGRVHPPTGNTIVDAVLRYAARARVALEDRERFALLTLHRAENVDDRDTMAEILTSAADACAEHDLVVVFPAHPRTLRRISEFDLSLPKTIELAPLKGFRELLALQATARLVLTDSGGLQEESCVLGTPCVTLRISTERPETVEVGANIVAGIDRLGILKAVRQMMERDLNWHQPLGDGRAAERIVDALEHRGSEGSTSKSNRRVGGYLSSRA